MKHRHSHLLVGYWGGLNAASPSASEAEFDEAIIHCLAPHIMILESGEGDEVSYTVAGSAVQRAIGRPLRGTCFFDHWHPRDRAMVRDFCRMAVLNRRPLCLLSFCGAQAFEFETVLVPVSMSDSRKARFIGISMALNEEPSPAPLHRLHHLMHIGFVRDELLARRSPKPKG